MEVPAAFCGLALRTRSLDARASPELQRQALASVEMAWVESQGFRRQVLWSYDFGSEHLGLTLATWRHFSTGAAAMLGRRQRSCQVQWHSL